MSITPALAFLVDRGAFLSWLKRLKEDSTSLDSLLIPNMRVSQDNTKQVFTKLFGVGILESSLSLDSYDLIDISLAFMTEHGTPFIEVQKPYPYGFKLIISNEPFTENGLSKSYEDSQGKRLNLSMLL